jgi:hypothetical protein
MDRWHTDDHDEQEVGGAVVPAESFAGRIRNRSHLPSSGQRDEELPLPRAEHAHVPVRVPESSTHRLTGDATSRSWRGPRTGSGSALVCLCGNVFDTRTGDLPVLAHQHGPNTSLANLPMTGNGLPDLQ